MRFARFALSGKTSYGLVEDRTVFPIDGSPFGDWKKTGESFPLDQIKLLSPTQPSKIVCVGLNYADHAVETHTPLPDEPCLFLKPPSAVIGHGDDIVYPEMASRVDYEAELALVISKTASHVAPDDWADHVLGYTCLNDVTARNLQSADGQWTRAKGFDTFAPIGPWIETDLSPDDLAVSARVNGETKQHSSTRHLIFPPSYLVPFISRIMTLLPGDVITTGTPAGISGMSVTDVVEVEIEGIGILRNTVRAPRS